MTKKGSYIFTNKKHSSRGILSAILGGISAASVLLAIYDTFRAGGIAQPRYGAAALFAALFSAAGLVLGIRSRLEPDQYYLFSYLGILLNGLVLAGIVLLVFVGVYGL